MGDRKLEKDAEGRRRIRGGDDKYLWSSRKQPGAGVHAFPNRVAAKPRESSTTTEIT